MACLTAAAELAAKAGRAVRACEVDLGAVFNAADATGLAEHMTLLMGTVEEESKEADTIAEILKVAAELESYKALSRAAGNKTTGLVKQATEKHAEAGGCSQCTDGGPELHTCVAQEIESGETKRPQDATLLQHAIDVKSLRSGLGAECKGIWTGTGTECQDGNCPSLKDDATETTTLPSTSREAATQAGSGQGSGHGLHIQNMEEQLRECQSQVNDARLRELGDDIDDIEAGTADPTVVGENRIMILWSTAEKSRDSRCQDM